MTKKDNVVETGEPPVTELQKTFIIISLLISALGAPAKSSIRNSCLTDARRAVNALLGDPS